MEGLLLFVVGLVELVGVVFSGLIAGVASLVSFVVELVIRVGRGAGVANRGRPPQSPESSSIPSRHSEGARHSGDSVPVSPPFRFPKWMLKASRGLFLVGSILVCIIAVINFFFFETAVEKIAGYVLGRSNVAFKHHGMKGNLFTGRIEVNGLDVSGATWRVKTDSFEIDMAIMSLLSKTKRIEKLRIGQLNGTATMPLPNQQHGSEPSRNERKKKRWFVIENCNVKDASVTMTHPNGELPPIHSVKIEALECQQFRTRWPLFYLLFRSNVKGALNDAAFEVVVEDRHPLGKSTRWNIASLPLNSLASQGGVFSIFEGGEVSLDVTDDWVISDHLEVDMDWKLTFSDITAKAPAGSIVRKKIAEHFNNSAGEPIEIAFRLKLDPDSFEGSSSESANALFSGIADGMIERFLPIGMPDKERIKEETNQGIKKLLDRARTPRD